jgi:polyphenol oxidase
MDSNTMLHLPTIFNPFPEVVAAQSTRHGGVSPAPWHTLNLGKSTDDHPDHVQENRRRFCGALGFTPGQMAWSKQVHGDQILTVTKAGGAEGFDAIVSNTPGILLAVSVADCTPILVYDRQNRAMAAIHAGWKGTVALLVQKTLQEMTRLFGTKPMDCHVFIGACIDHCSFEVGEEVAVQFDEVFKTYDPDKQKYFVDLKQANAAQCRNFGIPEQQIEISPYSTVLHHEHFFSHRKEKGITGRMLAAIGMPVLLES